MEPALSQDTTLERAAALSTRTFQSVGEATGAVLDVLGDLLGFDPSF